MELMFISHGKKLFSPYNSSISIFILTIFFSATPSKGFDMLASDFNKPLLALIVGGMGFIVLLLRNYHTSKLLRTNWQ